MAVLTNAGSGHGGDSADMLLTLTAEFRCRISRAKRKIPKVAEKWRIYQKEVRTSFSFYFSSAFFDEKWTKMKIKSKQRVSQKWAKSSTLNTTNDASYILQAGFNESLIERSIGHLQEIFLFLDTTFPFDSPIFKQLGKAFSPFPGVVWMPERSQITPVFNSDGSV